MTTATVEAVFTVPVITDGMSIMDAAVALAAAGFEVFPVDHPGPAQCAGAGLRHVETCAGPRGKHPAVSFTMAATTSPKMIKTWWEQERNIGIKCGSALVVIDEDTLASLTASPEITASPCRRP